MSVEIACYDVLVHNRDDERAASKEGGNGGAKITSNPVLALFHPKSIHVGNNRFQVFVNMYKNEFEQSKGQGHEESSSIINRIIDIVTKQCDPPGRFLVKKESLEDAGKEEWTFLERGRIEAFIEQTLSTPSRRNSKLLQVSQTVSCPDLFADGDDNDKKRGRRPSLLRRSVNDEQNPLADSKKKTSKTERRRSSGMMRWRSSTTRRVPAMPTIESEEFTKEGSSELSEETLDKREKSSESTIAENEKSEKSRPSAPTTTTPEKCSLGTTPRPTAVAEKIDEKKASEKDDVDQIKEIGPLDVVFKSSGDLLASTTGNKRIQILIDIKRAAYANAHSTTRTAMIKDLRDVVLNHWKAQFLREQGKYFKVVHPLTVETLLRSSLEEEFENDTAAFLQAHVSGITVPQKKRPSQLKREAVAAIHGLTPRQGDEEVTNVQKTAIENLLKQKSRKSLTARIRNLAKSTLRDESSSPDLVDSSTVGRPNSRYPFFRGHSSGSIDSTISGSSELGSSDFGSSEFGSSEFSHSSVERPIVAMSSVLQRGNSVETTTSTSSTTRGLSTLSIARSHATGPAAKSETSDTEPLQLSQTQDGVLSGDISADDFDSLLDACAGTGNGVSDPLITSDIHEVEVGEQLKHEINPTGEPGGLHQGVGAPLQPTIQDQVMPQEPVIPGDVGLDPIDKMMLPSQPLLQGPMLQQAMPVVGVLDPNNESMVAAHAEMQGQILHQPLSTFDNRNPGLSGSSQPTQQVLQQPIQTLDGALPNDFNTATELKYTPSQQSVEEDTEEEEHVQRIRSILGRKR